MYICWDGAYGTTLATIPPEARERASGKAEWKRIPGYCEPGRNVGSNKRTPREQAAGFRRAFAKVDSWTRAAHGRGQVQNPRHDLDGLDVKAIDLPTVQLQRHDSW